MTEPEQRTEQEPGQARTLADEEQVEQPQERPEPQDDVADHRVNEGL